jgi:hypothetical protein
MQVRERQNTSLSSRAKVLLLRRSKKKQAESLAAGEALRILYRSYQNAAADAAVA